MSQCNFVHHRSHIDCPRCEPGLPWWEASNKPPEIWHGLLVDLWNVWILYFHVVLSFLFQIFSKYWGCEVQWQSLKMERRKVCLFCNRDENNELLFGKIYELDDIVTHYYCLVRWVMDQISNLIWLLFNLGVAKIQSSKLWLWTLKPVFEGIRISEIYINVWSVLPTLCANCFGSHSLFGYLRLW